MIKIVSDQFSVNYMIICLIAAASNDTYLKRAIRGNRCLVLKWHKATDV